MIMVISSYAPGPEMVAALSGGPNGYDPPPVVAVHGPGREAIAAASYPPGPHSTIAEIADEIKDDAADY